MNIIYSTRYALLATIALGLAAMANSAQTAMANSAQTVYATDICPENEGVRTRELYALRLPDCRAYEQVSPMEKNNADALGRAGVVESSLSGNDVTFFSLVPFSGISGSSEYPTYLSARGIDAWLTQGLLPPTNPGATTGVIGLTEDLSLAVVADYPSNPVLAPEATTGQLNYYLRNNADGSYRLLAGGTVAVESSDENLHFVDGTPDDSRILFEEDVRLSSSGKIEALTPGIPHLYLWSNGKVTAVGVLENGTTPLGGSVAGAGGPAIAEEGLGEPGGAGRQFYTSNTISQNGMRVFFSGVENGQIYVRENGVTTVQVSASQRTPSEETPAFWRADTPDGRYAFFTSESKLTKGSTAEPRRPDLYRFDVDSKELMDLTVADPEGADVLGTLGVSESGAIVYFVAKGVLAGPDAEGAPEEGAANLYEWRNGETTFIARLNAHQDRADWSSFATGGETGPEGEKGSRVTFDGAEAMFTSVESLTPGYDNAGHIEIYLYDGGVSGGKLKCVSCDPNSQPADFNAYLVDSRAVASPSQLGSSLTHNLSTDGKRVFFETEESLVVRDSNNQMDVYEWESEGEGRCPRERSHGCLYLLSTGQSPDRSYFGDASADGDDVFLFTRQALVGQDHDENVDLYDARVGGGIADQTPSSPPLACTAGEECHGAPVLPPLFGEPVSAMFPAEGNIAHQSAKSIKRPKVKRKDKAKRGRRWKRELVAKKKGKNVKAHVHGAVERPS